MPERSSRPSPRSRAVVPPETEVQPGEVVRYIQEQLLDAQLQREAEGILPLFEVECLELEMRVCLSTRTTGSGKVDLKMLAVTKDATVEEQYVHTVRLKLRAIDEGNDSRVPDGRRPSARRVK